MSSKLSSENDARAKEVKNISCSTWSNASWRDKTAVQQPNYPDQGALEAVLAQLGSLPPLVTSWEIEKLKSLLAQAVLGKHFLLQGGDCAESLSTCEPSEIIGKLKTLMQMSLVIAQGAKRPVIRVGRIAGQYAKPRSADFETRGGVTLPTYRGDCVNRVEFTPEGRTPCPELLLRAYERSALTLNFIRALAASGFADLHHPEHWNFEFFQQSPNVQQYQLLVNEITSALQFWETIVGSRLAEAERVDFFTSHEALLLPFEQALTRQVPHRSPWYNLSTHLPWLGYRTQDLDGAHVEYLRGIANPVGVKIGPGVKPEDALALSRILNPDNVPGRLVFIHRFGARKVKQWLAPVVEAIVRNKQLVLWCCDPMHGNTEVTSSGLKTRRFDDILAEVEESFYLLRDAGAHLGGVHLELTGENVTECIGGSTGIAELDLSRDYRSAVDPRLNYDQALELALLLARLLAKS